LTRQDETWVEFSTLELAAIIQCSHIDMKRNNLVESSAQTTFRMYPVRYLPETEKLKLFKSSIRDKETIFITLTPVWKVLVTSRMRPLASLSTLLFSFVTKSPTLIPSLGRWSG
jgi:hypothetical protein